MTIQEKFVKSFNDIRIKYFLAKKFTNLHKASIPCAQKS